MVFLSSLLCVFMVVETIIVTAQSHEIDDDWFRTGNGYRYHMLWTWSSWHEARSYCQSIGGDLAAQGMKNYGTRVAIANIMLVEDVSFWIGLNDLTHEGQWLWVDGDTGTSSNTHWAGGEPNNKKGKEDCAEINSNGDYRAIDTDCNNNLPALCEKKV